MEYLFRALLVFLLYIFYKNISQVNANEVSIFLFFWEIYPGFLMSLNYENIYIYV